MRIKEHPDPFCYLVESESKPEQPYFVDLTARNGHGQCNCKHYQTQANPNYKQHGKFTPYSLSKQGKLKKGVSECKHIAIARNYYHINVTQPMLAAFNKQ